MSKLIIVESPNKIKHIKHFVGDGYRVMASVGHIRRIADTGAGGIGVDCENGFVADYVVDAAKKDVVKNLKDAVKESSVVYLASDDDAEGEAIAWHIKDLLKIPDSKVKRAIFKEITEKSVLDGIANAGVINEAKAKSALSRAKLDKILGYKLSKVVYKKTGGKSAGRVQSVALKLVCDREQEIREFIPRTYFELYLNFRKDSDDIYKAKYIGTSSKKVKEFDSKENVEAIINECNTTNKYEVTNITVKEKEKKTKLPFITSTLQQEASNRFGMSPSITSSNAQKLFEKGLITYIRTDSTRLSEEFVAEANAHIVEVFGKEFLGSSAKPKAKAKGNVQDAHEAIRCIDVKNTPASIKATLTPQEYKMYELIYNRTLASLMANAKYEHTDVTIKNGSHLFSATGRRFTFLGFMTLYVPEDDDEEQAGLLPPLVKGEVLNDIVGLDLVEKTTNPPARYKEASLIKKMDELKIGRPSTYASMTSVITDESRGYTTVEKRVIIPTEKGELVNKFLSEHFNTLINFEYTAELENKLDSIAAGSSSDLDLLEPFYAELIDVLGKSQDVVSMKPVAENANKPCPLCGKDLLIRNGRAGSKFLGCSGYPKCKHIESLDGKEPDKVKCDACETGYIVKRVATKGRNKGNAFYACNAYPKCSTIIDEKTFMEKLEKEKQ